MKLSIVRRVRSSGLHRTDSSSHSNRKPTIMVNLRHSLCALVFLFAGHLIAQDVAANTPAAIPAPIDPPVPVAPSAPVAANVPVPPADGSVTVTQQTVPGVPAAASEPLVLPATAARLNDFQGDPIDLVLRTLARQAKMNIVVTDAVTQAGGTVNMRIEDKTPKEAIEIIVESKGLIMDQGKGGVYFIKTAAEKQKEPTESGSYTFSYAQAKDIVPLLQTQLQSGVAPQFDQRTNTVFYRENRSNLEKIKLFLETIDKPTQQEMNEARVGEVTANPHQAYGINWGGVVGGYSNPQTFRYGGSLVTQQTTNTSGNAVNTGTTITNGVTGQPNGGGNLASGVTTTTTNALGLGDF